MIRSHPLADTSRAMTDEETSSRRVYNDKSVYKNILTFLPNPDRRNCMTTSREQLPVAITVLYEEVTEDVLGKVFAAFCPRVSIRSS